MANQQDLDAVKRAGAQTREREAGMNQQEQFDMLMRGRTAVGGQFNSGGNTTDPDLLNAGLTPGVDFNPGKLETEFMTALGRFGSDMTRKGASFMREGDRSIARSRNSPEFQQFQDFINKQFQDGMASLPGVQQFQQGELDRSLGQRDQQQGRLDQAQDWLAQLSNPNQSVLDLPPALRDLIDTQRQLRIDRSQVGVGDVFTKLSSLSNARMGAKGLGDSTIAARADNEIQNDLENRLESARIKAEEDSINQEFGLRGQALQERGQQQQGAISMSSIAQNQLMQIQQLLGTNSPAAQAALQATLGQLFAQPLNAFTQQNLNNEQRSLQTAAGVGHATDDSGGFGDVFASIGNTLGSIVGGGLFGSSKKATEKATA